MDAPARPVPPIYRPEQAADAIVAAAEDGRRSDVLGSWNRMIVSLASVAPGVVGHFSADTGLAAQQADGPDRKRATNLSAPVLADHEGGLRRPFPTADHGVTTPTIAPSPPGTPAPTRHRAGPAP